MAAFSIILIVSFFEIKYLLKRSEKKEAIVYIALLVLTTPLALYVSLAPKFGSFVEIVFSLFGIN